VRANSSTKNDNRWQEAGLSQSSIHAESTAGMEFIIIVIFFCQVFSCENADFCSKIEQNAIQPIASRRVALTKMSI
jgi:hypothetical protein